MAKREFSPPDPSAMERLMARHDGDLTGLVLRLAWREGLKRAEIAALTWGQVDLEEALLRLPDREVPLEAETAQFLRRRMERGGRGHVAVSDRLRRPAAPETLSRLAREALDEAGLEETDLRDLRWDFIRRQLETHDWTHVLRIAGLSVATYREVLSPLFQRKAPSRPKGAEAADEYRIWRIMQTGRGGPETLALWLVQQQGMALRRIAELTWADVDLDAGTVDGAPATQGLRRVLESERLRRGPDDDPHVILSPRSRKPMNVQQLSALLRTVLIRGGVEDLSAVDIRRGAARGTEDARVLEYIAARGSITTAEAATLLGLDPGAARRRLAMLTERGTLVRVGARCYAADRTPAPEEHRAIILEQMALYGSLRSRDAAEVLNIAPRQAGALLRAMAAEGLICREEGGKRYVLPDEKITMS
ncbi:MAG: winged helix-turn-helix transcriptional regulator [Oscillospiraceae bacterium]|nr:winged helix-turn-helix transcriptional regulator [Oscillospiraceae bacterium]